jgi:hypothetical protein
MEVFYPAKPDSAALDLASTPGHRGPGEGGVEGNEVVTAVRSNGLSRLQGDALTVATVLRTLLPARGLRQDPPHGFRGGGEEVAAFWNLIVPVHFRESDCDTPTWGLGPEPGQTLQATALVPEVYRHLGDRDSGGHFSATSAS